MTSLETFGSHTSLVLDGSGNPVLSYHEPQNRGPGAELWLLHCGDANCSSGNVAFSPHTVGNDGRYAALALDADGNPVVSYQGNGALQVLHCDDPNCVAARSSARA